MFEWDEAKNQLNLEKHGISFEEAAEIFNYPVFTRIDKRNNYGEIREISFGMIGLTLVLVVVHTDRNGKTRLISARKANKNERHIYHDYLKKTLEGY